MGCLKFLLIIFNLLIWVFGAGLTGIGIWIKLDKDFWKIQTGLDLQQFSSASTVLIVAGVIIMVIGFLGCYGGIAEKICMLILYSIVVFIIILLQVAVVAMVWMAVTNKETEEHIKNKIKKGIQGIIEKNNTLAAQFVNLLQKELKCCGVDGPSDYKGDVPDSCTNKDSGKLSEKGCLEVTIEYIKSKAKIVGGVAAGVFLLEVASLILTLCVACGIKNGSKRIIY